MPQHAMFQDRRYVGSKETMAYVLFDASKGFNINGYNGRFFLDLVKIDFGWNAAAGFIRGIWDILNDTFAGVLVDKTMTRWGKFKPYLLSFAIPGTIFGVLYWMTPYFFGSDPKSVSKLLFWSVLGMTQELMGTFRGFAEIGFISSISPNQQDKARLFTMAEVISGLWESFPGMAMGVIIDLINHGKLNLPMRSAYLVMGSLCAVQGGLFALYFAGLAKERIAQSVDKPTFKEGFRTILNNKPMLLMMLSDFMKVFKFDTGMQNYYIDVLGSASVQNIILIPGAPLSLLSYTYVPWAQRKFSTKTLWIFGDHERDLTSILVFLIGCVGGRGKNGLYNKMSVMLPALMVKDVIYKSTLGIFKIIPRMMLTEALDYCEWKNGYRTEGTTLAAKGIATKITGLMMGPLHSLLMKQIGYSLQAGFGLQSQKTKYYLFALCTLLPGLTGLLGILPKIFYNVSLESRDRMYEELARVRAEKRNAFAERESGAAVE